jgi:hypothetical protein
VGPRLQPADRLATLAHGDRCRTQFVRRLRGRARVDTLDGRSADYGHDHLADTVADFCDRWEIGVEHLATDGQEVAQRLSQNVQDYRKVDTATAGRMNGLLQRPAGPDPGAH